MCERKNTMPVHPMIALVAALAVTGAVATVARGTVARHDPERLLGPDARLGNGTVRSYVTLGQDRQAVAVGVSLTEGALEGLETGHGHHELVLSLPDVPGIVFQHITMGWNPAGHEPPGVYDLPHFDVHFFTIDDATRRTIVPTAERFSEKGARLPAGEWAPPGYMADPNGAVPLMGTHWIDREAPELNGRPFTRTFIFGSWDGALTFVEPMLTRDWLSGRPDFRADVTLPAKVPVSGLWPTEWSVTFDEAAREYRIELAGLEVRGS